MTRDEFWQHIRATRRTDAEEHGDRLTARLAKLPVNEILSFGRWWYLALARAYTWKLWAAAYLVNGGCSDDGFLYFRIWLVLQGRKVYEAAVKNPESLAALLKGDGDVEAECYPASEAYTAATGREDYVTALEKRYPKLPDYPELKDGWDFDDEAQMRKRYPKLATAFIDEEE